ncbi:MAG: hypothetical protein KBS83_04430, partial [Lachnospiraceae bacterium]|nr:hypothetical protein [Candidatus Equihabitans merdae]
MDQKNMELFLISGFLGSGKTSFMRSVLTELPNHKIGVIVNDFGSVNIDGKLLRNGDLKLVEINNGSVFCACLKGGFIKTLAAFLEVDVDYLFVEASGLADPDNMDEYLQAVYMLTDKKGKTKRRYSYRGNICVADAVNFLDYLDVFPVIENQARKSRFILLNKEAEISPEEKEELKAELERLNPEAFIYETNYGKVPPEILTAHLIPEQEHVSTLNTPYNRPCVLIVTMAPGQEQNLIE